MAWRRRHEDAENPAWPGLVDIFGFTLAFLLLLWFAANWPEKVASLERQAKDLGVKVASANTANRQLLETNQSLAEKLRLQGVTNQELEEKLKVLGLTNKGLTDQVNQLEENNKNLETQSRLLQGNVMSLDNQVQQLNNEKLALREIGLKDWEELLQLLHSKLAKTNLTIIPNRAEKAIEIQGQPRVTFGTMQYELSPNDAKRLEWLAPILLEMRHKKKFYISINGTADPREVQSPAPPRNNTELSALRAAAVAALLEKSAPGLGNYLRVTGLGVKGAKRSLNPGENADAAYRQYRSVNLVLKIDVAALMQANAAAPAAPVPAR